ncbi:MAG: hypothetical protein IJG83_09435 [Thermoguttaceae bacterium]|nr:hypothetical protein [Thermoguttaceae bacterium]
MRYDTITADTAPLWEAYFITRGIEERNRLVLALKEYFDAVVAKWVYKRPYLFGRMDDVLSTAYVYLLDTIAKVDPALHAVQRMKYLITSVLWQLHTYFNSTDKGLKRRHQEIIDRRGIALTRLNPNIDVEDKLSADPLDELVSQESTLILDQALKVGKKTGRLSPSEAWYIKAQMNGENLLDLTSGYWRTHTFIRFKALARELSGEPFVLYSFLRLPARRFKWSVDSHGEEVREDIAPQRDYSSICWDSVNDPRAASFTCGPWRLCCYRPDPGTSLFDAWNENTRNIRQKVDPFGADRGYKFSMFWGWLAKYLEVSQTVEYRFGDKSRFVFCGEQNCFQQLKDKGVIHR